MARTMKIVLTDDIDGSTADETVEFSLDNQNYEIELSAENAAKLRGVLEPYIQNARRVAGTRAPKRKTTSASRFDPAQVRAWAQENGLEVSSRGRISADVLDAYERSLGK